MGAVELLCFTLFLQGAVLFTAALPTAHREDPDVEAAAGTHYVDVHDSHQGSMAEDIDLRIEMAGKSMKLKLHRSSRVGLNVPLVYGANSHNTIMLPSQNKETAVYTDQQKEASIIIQMIGGGKHYDGHFFDKNIEYEIRPSRSSADFPNNPSSPPSNSQVRHVVSRVREQRSSEVQGQQEVYESIHVNQWAAGAQDIPVRRGFRKLQVNNTQGQGQKAERSGKYDVEMLFVIDYSIYKEWYGLSSKVSDEDKMMDALENIQFYYTHIANGVSMRYQSVSESDFKMDTTISGFYIATEADAAPWTRDNTISFQPKNIIDGDPALRQFQNWLETNRQALPSFDQATLFIDDYLKGWSGNRILGMAIIEGVCSRYSTAISREIGQYGTIQTFTHELGHSLGAYHDGDQNECRWSDQYIMASYPTTLTQLNFRNPFQFSQCSVNYFKSFIDYMDTNNYNCLEDGAVAIHNTTEILKTLPGQEYTPDEQCVIIFGQGAYYCGGNSEDKNMCLRMECFDPNARRCVVDAEQRAAPGTTCGNKKWCQKGECVFSPDAPVALDDCTYGDYKGPYTNGLTCDIIGVGQPWVCYNIYYLDDCCATCEQIKDTTKPDCPYGDRDPAVCSNVTASDCLNTQTRSTCCRTCVDKVDTDCPNEEPSWCATYIRSSYDCHFEGDRCCQTCNKYRTGIEGCVFGNSADWCDRYITQASYCYNEGQRCCGTCQKFKNQNNPDCLYGDKISDCSSRSCDDVINRERCCETCALRQTTTSTTSTSTSMSTTTASTSAVTLSTTVSPGECRDSQNWCSRIKASSCYDQQTRSWCCKTCGEKYKAVQGCEYGNHYTWCSQKYCAYPQEPELYNKCCGVCWPLSITTTTTTSKPTTDTNCRDKANWCTAASFSSSFCYDKTTRSDTCCRTCVQIYDPSQPGCEYGDKRTWCGPQWCSSEKNNCCQSCRTT